MSGRDPKTGRFEKGWKGGPGNPHGGRSARFRSMLLSKVTDQHLEEALEALMEQVRQGNISAIRELLDRVIGKSVANDVLERLDDMESKLSTLGNLHNGAPDVDSGKIDAA